MLASTYDWKTTKSPVDSLPIGGIAYTIWGFPGCERVLRVRLKKWVWCGKELRFLCEPTAASGPDWFIMSASVLYLSKIVAQHECRERWKDAIEVLKQDRKCFLKEAQRLQVRINRIQRKL